MAECLAVIQLDVAALSCWGLVLQRVPLLVGGQEFSLVAHIDNLSR